MKRILIVEGHTIIRKQLIQYFSALNVTYTVEEVTTREQALEKVAQARFDLIVIDISQPMHNGLETLADLQQEVSDTAIMVLSGSAHHKLRRNFTLLGCHAYLARDASKEHIVEAAAKLLAGEPYISQIDEPAAKDDEKDIHLNKLKKLTRRELQVFLKLASGTSTKSMSNQLRVSSSTISVIKAQIMKKLDFKNDYELFQFALDARMVPPRYLLDLPNNTFIPDYS
jgi:two-component system invasion response regulator UvrY